MKLCLGIAYYNERPWLALHLPVILQSGAIDGIVALDGGSTDGDLTDIPLNGREVIPIQRTHTGNFSQYFNELIAAAEDSGFDAILRLDPDEAMFPEDIDDLKRQLTLYKAVCFARYNFEPDRFHYAPYPFPDYQLRAWRLREGVYYGGMIHEQIIRPLGWVETDNIMPQPRDVIDLPHLHIFHYGAIYRDKRWWLKHANNGRLLRGEPLSDELPPDWPPLGGAPRFNVPFAGRQPIDPVGPYAPFDNGGGYYP